MALIVKDRVQEISTTVGTGTLTLSGAVLGFQSFAAIGDGNTTYYAINDPITGDWEVGIGTYTSSGTTLSRDTVLSSSTGASLISFAAGTKNVFCTYPSERAIYLDSAGSYPVQNTFNTLNATTAVLTAGTVSTTPSSGNDIANKTYVDTIAAAGIHYHDPVYVESPSTAGNLNATYNQPGGPGVGVGATLTNAGTKAALVIDGVSMAGGERVLIYNQTNAFENGVYTVTTVGTPDPGGTNWVLTRATDADTYAPSSPNSLGQGDAFFVTNGDTGAGEGYVCTTVGTITFGTTGITFVQFSASKSYNAGTGLDLTNTTFSIANTAVTPTSYGTASSVGTFTVNAQGQITSAVDTPIAIGAGAVSGLAASATTDTTNASNITSGTLGTSRLSGSYTGITGVGALAAGSLATGFTAVSAPLGGTGQTSYTVGDILYADTSTSIAKLADVAVGNALISGGIAAAPSWGKIGLATHVSGTLPVANGGTGVTSSTGTGSVVLSTSPTLVTPALGTPSSGTVTNLTGTASININGTVGATTPSTGSFTSLTDSGNLAFTGTGNRITGDFSNATVANRVMFQTSTVDGITNLGVMPNGTGISSLLTMFGSSSDLANTSTAQFGLFGTECRVTSGITGTGTYRNMTFYTGGSEAVRIDTSQRVTVQKSSNGALTALTSSSASIAVNLNLANNFTHTTTENTTLANPTNMTAGQYGVIVITQGATPRTMAFGSYWDFQNGTVPSLTSTASAVDVIAFYVASTTKIIANFLQDVK